MLALLIMMLAASAFGGVAEPEPPPIADQMTPELLAQVIAEAGGIGIWKTEEATRTAWRFVMYTALNRYRDPAFPTMRDFLQGFYRRDSSPPPEAIEIAAEVLEANPRDDPTRGCKYSFSQQDLELLGIVRRGDIVLRGNSVFSLHLYREEPWSHD